MALKRDDAVRLVQPIIRGVIITKAFDDAIDAFRYLVRWTDGDGEVVERWFAEGEIEADPDAAEAE